MGGQGTQHQMGGPMGGLGLMGGAPMPRPPAPPGAWAPPNTFSGYGAQHHQQSYGGYGQQGSFGEGAPHTSCHHRARAAMDQWEEAIIILLVQAVTMEIIQEVTHMQLKVQLHLHLNHPPTTRMGCPVLPPSTPTTWPAMAGARLDHQPRCHIDQHLTKRNYTSSLIISGGRHPTNIHASCGA